MLTEKSSSAVAIEKRTMTSPTHELQVSVFFSQNNVIVSLWHMCSFTSSVCFSLKWPGLISSFYPLQFWWGPKCLLSGIAKGNLHKPHKSLKKLMAKLSRSLFGQAASSPCAALPWVSVAALQRDRGRHSSPQVLLALHQRKDTLTQSTFSVFAQYLRDLIAGICRATPSLSCFCNLQIKGDEGEMWFGGLGTIQGCVH